MKTNTLLTTLTACLFTLTFTACDKKPAVEVPAAPATNATAASAMDAAKNLAGQAVDTAKDATAKAVDSTKEAAAKLSDTAKDMTAKAMDSTKEASGKLMDTVKGMTVTTATNAIGTNVDMPGMNTPVKTTDAVKDAAAQALAASTNAVNTTFTEVVTVTKKDIEDKNYQGALEDLKKLSDVKLSDEQQKVVDGLKAQAQSMISSGAANAAKSLFGK